ncbi:MAG: Xaa-Pro peptidase family protein, partial [Alphaproteobacteria bacterium]
DRRNTDLAKKTPGAGIKDYEAQVDTKALRAYRLGRVQEQLQQRDWAAAILYDPINIRYATGSRNMAVWTLHNHVRYAFVPAQGLPVLFEFGGARRNPPAAKLESVGEVRGPKSWTYFYSGDKKTERAIGWADEVMDLIRQHCGANRRIAFDHLDPIGSNLMQDRGVEIMDGEALMERARLIKGPEEIQCMQIAISVCETGMARMRQALKPGMTENALWSLLHQANIELGGEWIETRLLSSGGRTNPWMQESGERIIRPGDLVAFDTDLIGPFGYCADISRTYFCGPGRPSEAQKALYRASWEQIQHNTAIVRPGMTFRQVTEQEWPIPNQYVANRYGIMHGVGMADEYPFIFNHQDADIIPSPDEVLQPGMTLSVESYIGLENGAEGVKLEDQVLVTETGVETLSSFPFEEELLN